MIPFRYDLPWTGRVIRVEAGEASAVLPSRDVNAMLTATKAPIQVALRIQALSRGESFRARRGNETIRFCRDK